MKLRLWVGVFGTTALLAGAGCKAEKSAMPEDGGVDSGGGANDGFVSGDGLLTDHDGGTDYDLVPPEGDLLDPRDFSGNVGYATRPANPTCNAPNRPVPIDNGTYSVEPLLPNLQLGDTGPFGGETPIVARRVRMPTDDVDPDNAGHVLPGAWVWVVAQRNGHIFSLEDANLDTATMPTVSMRSATFNGDLSQSEGGFLGLTFDPALATDPTRAFAYYVTAQYGGSTDPDDFNGVQLRRARVTATPRSGGGYDYGLSEHTLLLTASASSHHHGGDVQFGPDGFLYMSVGEGDVGNRARSPRNLRGKILRLDVHATGATANYAIPTTNPYRLNGSNNPNPACSETTDNAPNKATDCPEIFAVGFRNPFRMSFDSQTGSLWVGDVGSQHEEINIVELGKDYGWDDQEGTTSSTSGVTPAVAEIPRTGCTGYGYAIIGGYVYHGSAIPSLQGKYVTADNDAGKLFVVSDPYGATPTVEGVYNTECGDATFHPSSFTEDENGELYVVVLHDGAGKGIYKIVPQGTGPGPGTNPLSPTLSGTGCTVSGDVKQYVPGAIPYELNSPLWSDGLVKRRFMALPNGQNITVEASGDWTFPIGTVLIKEFATATKRIETRLLVRHEDGDWAGYTYVWNSNDTEAMLADAAQTVDVGDGGALWDVPSRVQCLGCHSTGRGRSLGPETRQMNRLATYPDGTIAEQLKTLEHIGLLPAAYADPTAHGKLTNPADFSQSTDSRVRSYLHANCAHCHPGPGSKPNFLIDTSFAAMTLCDESPTTPVAGGTALVEPGDAAHSILYLRMDSLGTDRMPRLGSRRRDPLALSLVQSWINDLNSCP